MTQATKHTGGSSFPCALCDSCATIKQGRQWLCDLHYRFRQMRASAKRHGKAVPSMSDLSAMSGASLICPDCHVQMNWRSKDGLSTVASLQHYRDGSMNIVCKSCNTRHAFMPADTYREMNKDCKLCPSCNSIKPLSEFTKDASRAGQAQRKSKCKACSDKSAQKWKEQNRDKYNQYQREYRAKRKAASNAVLQD